MRDRTLNDTIHVLFSTRDTTGLPTVLAGTPVVSAYEDDSLIQITAGVTLTVNHDGVTGLNRVTINATGANGFEDGKEYSLVLTAGSVGGTSVVGEVVGEFSLGKTNAQVDTAITDAALASQASVDVIDSTADAILVDTGTTIPATLTTIEGKIDTIDTTADAILVDTGTTLPATLTTIEGKIDTIDGIVDAILIDTGTDIPNTLATLATATALAAVDTVVDAIKAVTDNLPDSGALTSIAQASALTAVNNICTQLNLGIIYGATAAGTLTTTACSSNLTGYADDQLIGRVIIFTSGAAEGEASAITDYALTNGVITYEALTVAPGAGDSFKIV